MQNEKKNEKERREKNEIKRGWSKRRNWVFSFI